MKSEITKKYQRLYTLMVVLEIIVLLGPVLYYVATGFIIASAAAQFTLSAMAICAIFLTIVSLLFKFKLSSPIWILILGIYIAIQNILPLIICLAVGTILDEFLLHPLKKRFRNQARINREIDKRS